jgi:hypothetical protein
MEINLFRRFVVSFSNTNTFIQVSYYSDPAAFYLVIFTSKSQVKWYHRLILRAQESFFREREETWFGNYVKYHNKNHRKCQKCVILSVITGTSKSYFLENVVLCICHSFSF